LAAPVDRPISFEITSSAVMNSFFVPALAGQIYSMAGMKTKLHAVINKPGIYDGFSANYSGNGFTHMRFKFHGVSNEGFDQWVNNAKASNLTLDREKYMNLALPTQREPVVHYSEVAPDLFDAIVNQCVDGKSTCMKDIMHNDMNRKGRLDVSKIDRVLEEALCSAETADQYLNLVEATPTARVAE
jgi:cytochrome o ubiquinol oxidase subunit 2